MAIRNVSVEVLSRGRKLARGVCILVAPGRPERGTVSQLRWVEPEPNLTGHLVHLRLDGGEELLANVLRHGQVEGVSFLRFQVA